MQQNQTLVKFRVKNYDYSKLSHRVLDQGDENYLILVMLQILGYGSVPLPSPILDVRHYAGQSHLPHVGVTTRSQSY
jgi:hypothetical protein